MTSFLFLLFSCNRQKCPETEVFFATRMQPLLEENCIGCHNSSGLASESRLIIQEREVKKDRPSDVTNANMNLFVSLLQDDSMLLTDKTLEKRIHGGGKIFDRLSEEYSVIYEFQQRVIHEDYCELELPSPNISCDDGVYPSENPYRRLTDLQYRNSIRHILGTDIEIPIVPNTTKNKDFRTWSSNNQVSGTFDAQRILEAGENISVQIDTSNACSDNDSNCLQDLLLSYAQRFYRRKLSNAERQVFVDIFSEIENPRQSFTMGMIVILSSPQFLYLDVQQRSDEDDSDEEIPYLDDYSIASRLSYFLWNAPPDEQLLDLASKGKLHTKGQVQEQAIRMVESPKVLDTVVGFHEDWLDLYLLENIQRDTTLYPLFYEGMISSMKTETRLFLSNVFWYGDANWDDLFFEQSTHINQELATLYGMEQSPTDWDRVEVSEERAGLFQKSAFLTAHSYFAASSPVKRGHYILSEMLCIQSPIPVDVEMVLPDESQETPTIRERLQQHWTDANCASCHIHIDNLGFAFENYDAIGQWRDEWENGFPVDATGSFTYQAFDNSQEMLGIINSEQRAKSCYAQNWFSYAMGRPVVDSDVCSLEELNQRFLEEGNVRKLLIDIATSDAFLMGGRL